jgi:caffeoyl-CoA O-methyltransferase
MLTLVKEKIQLYAEAHTTPLPLLAANGLIAVDNVLWSGRVVKSHHDDDDTRAIVAFNDHVQRDDRVSNVMLTLRDGVTLVRKKQ